MLVWERYCADIWTRFATHLFCWLHVFDKHLFYFCRVLVISCSRPDVTFCLLHDTNLSVDSISSAVCKRSIQRVHREYHWGYVLFLIFCSLGQTTAKYSHWREMFEIGTDNLPASFMNQTVTLPDDTLVKFQIWDTGWVVYLCKLTRLKLDKKIPILSPCACCDLLLHSRISFIPLCASTASHFCPFFSLVVSDFMMLLWQ
jgi:hypothetical protein